MSGTVVAAAALALLAALAFAIATVAQQRAAARSSDVDARGLAFVWQLLRRPQWWAGTGGNVFGYGLQAVALGVGSLLIVQPILVTSLLFALPLGARVAHRRLPRAVWVWGAILVVALAVFVSLARPNRGISHASNHDWLIAGIATVTVVGACLVTAQSRSGATRASLLAIAAGVLEGVLAVLTKGVADLVPNGVVALVTSGETYGLIVVGLAGVYLQQLAFQAGALQASMPIVVVLEPMIAAALGLVLLHEHLDASGLTVAVLAAAVVAMTIATVVLARSEAAVATVTAGPEPTPSLISG
jgi:drug/metabolite transporter (DMT)-like permease